MNVAACAGHAKHITDRLRAMGHADAEARFVSEAHAVVCNFVLVANAPAWRKSLALDPAEASAEAFLDLFGQWQANMREALVRNRPGPRLAGAVAAHGAQALRAIGQAAA